MTLIEIKSAHAIIKTDLFWVVTNTRTMKYHLADSKGIYRYCVWPFEDLGNDLLTSNEWLPISDLDYLDAQKYMYKGSIEFNYFEETFGKKYK